MSKIRHFIASLTFLTLIISSDSNDQSQVEADKISSCIQHVANLWSNDDLNFTIQDLNNICRNLSQTTSCINKLGYSATNPDVAVLWQGTNDAFSYMCSDNSASDAFFSDPCFKIASSTNRGINLCSSIFSSGSRFYTYETICPAFDSLLKCIEGAVASCTDQGEKFYVTFRYKLLKPTASIVYNCTLNEPQVAKPALLSSAPRQQALILLPVAMFICSLRG